MADYQNYYASLVNFTKGFAASITGPKPPSFVDFDLHMAASTLPKGDLVGIRGMAVTIDQTTADISILFGVSTMEDTGHFRHRMIIDQLMHRLMPTKKVEFIDADTSAVLGYMIVKAGMAILPMSKTTTRSFQQISVNLLADRRPGP